MNEEIVPIPNSPTEVEIVDSVQQLQRVMFDFKGDLRQIREDFENFDPGTGNGGGGSGFSGSYNDLTNIPTSFPSSWNAVSNKPNFSAVAFSGSYNDLSNTPLGQETNWSDVQNKPIFSAVAFSGSYNDLSDTPSSGGGGVDYGTVTFVDGLPAVYEDSSTTLNVTTPSNGQVGDIIIMSLFARSELTHPTGWTLLVSEYVEPFTQTTYFYYKVVSDLSEFGESFQLQQASANRFAAAFGVFNGDKDIIEVEGFKSSTRFTLGDSIPEICTVGKGRVAVVAFSEVYAISSAQDLWVNPIEEWANITELTLGNNRLYLGYRSPNNLEIITGTVETDDNSDESIGIVTAMLVTYSN